MKSRGNNNRVTRGPSLFRAGEKCGHPSCSASGPGQRALEKDRVRLFNDPTDLPGARAKKNAKEKRVQMMRMAPKGKRGGRLHGGLKDGETPTTYDHHALSDCPKSRV